ncbi:8153_t:CDS:2, partial [Gigaspora rosea]
VLNIAKKYGWKVAVELPQSKSKGYWYMFFQEFEFYKRSGSRANHAGDKTTTHQIENEIGFMVQKEKEIITSHATIVKN